MKLLRFSPWIVLGVFAIGTFVLWLYPYAFLGYGGGRQSGREYRIATRSPSKAPGRPPIFAYWISGTQGEVNKVLRLLKAVYHPRNRYLLHLDSDSSESERNELLAAVQSEKVFQAFANVAVVSKAYAVDRTGPTLVAATLHAAAILLKRSLDWDWFISLSSSDYPIVTQDDLLHAFTSVPRDLNFIDHTSELGWKEYDRFKRIVVDPSLFLSKNKNYFHASQIRDTPDAFKIFTGSPWMILSRPFVEFCVLSWDNLPRKLLMYFSNVAYAMESYFQTVICNSPEFRNTTVNNDLRYFVWDNPPKLNPLILNLTHYRSMTASGAAFTRRFVDDDDLVLRKIDKSILRRKPDGVCVGQWCTGVARRGNATEDLCSVWGDIDVVRPRASGKKLMALVSNLVSAENLHSNQCLSV